MIKPRVTIGVCVRNGEGLIEEAIDSILEQDFPHEQMEVIFVDDGSQDRTLSIVNSYIPKIDTRVKVFHHEWKGLGTTRNVVANNAKGEYIVWVDCDMKLSRDFVRRQVEFMDRNPNVGICKGKYGMYDTSGLAAYLENIEGIVEFRNHEQQTMYKPLGTGGAIYRLKALEEVGGFDDNIKGVGEDMDVEFRIRRAGWTLKTCPATFCEIRRKNWKALWNEYLWHGFGGHILFHKTKRPLSMLHRMFPPTAILIQVSNSCTAYRLVNKKAVFLLPFHWIFKRTAWGIGFVVGHVKMLSTDSCQVPTKRD